VQGLRDQARHAGADPPELLGEIPLRGGLRLAHALQPGEPREPRQLRGVLLGSGLLRDELAELGRAAREAHREHYNRHRPHRALDLLPPDGCDADNPPLTAEPQIRRRDLLGGLIHEYERAA
jgi:transposase InsO family protein